MRNLCTLNFSANLNYSKKSQEKKSLVLDKVTVTEITTSLYYKY